MHHPQCKKLIKWTALKSRIYKISSEIKYINKQLQQAKTSTEQRGKSDFESCHILLFKNVQFSIKFMKHGKKQVSMVHIQGKKETIETAVEVQKLNLAISKFHEYRS